MKITEFLKNITKPLAKLPSTAPPRDPEITKIINFAQVRKGLEFPPRFTKIYRVLQNFTKFYENSQKITETHPLRRAQNVALAQRFYLPRRCDAKITKFR